MQKAENGDTVKVHYTGRLPDGTVFDTSSERGPLEFTIGEQRIIPGVESAVVGMATGEARTVQVEPEQAYGPHRDDLVFRVGRTMLPGGLEPQVGQRLTYGKRDGESVPLRVTEVDDSAVTLDANHPLAGKELTFELELVEIVATD